MAEPGKPAKSQVLQELQEKFKDPGSPVGDKGIVAGAVSRFGGSADSVQASSSTGSECSPVKQRRTSGSPEHSVVSRRAQLFEDAAENEGAGGIKKQESLEKMDVNAETKGSVVIESVKQGTDSKDSPVKPPKPPPPKAYVASQAPGGTGAKPKVSTQGNKPQVPPPPKVVHPSPVRQNVPGNASSSKTSALPPQSNTQSILLRAKKFESSTESGEDSSQKKPGNPPASPKRGVQKGTVPTASSPVAAGLSGKIGTGGKDTLSIYTKGAPSKTVQKSKEPQKGSSPEHAVHPAKEEPIYAKVNKAGREKTDVQRTSNGPGAKSVSVQGDPALRQNYDGVVILGQQEVSKPETIAGPKVSTVATRTSSSISQTSKPQPPKKPPRTFAHEEYLKVRADKLDKNKQESTQCQIDLNKTSSPKKTSAHQYEEIDVASEKSPKRSLGAKSRRDTQGYEIVDPETASNRASFEDKQGKSVESSEHRKRISSEKSKPIPPARPPAPSPRPISGESSRDFKYPVLQKTDNSEPSTPVDSSRWEKGFIRVMKHNQRLPQNAFVNKERFTNPGYGAKQWDVLKIKTYVAPDGSLKRYKSDECLYAEPVIMKPMVFEEDSPIYQDPIDAVPDRKRGSGPGDRHGVVVDEEGYAIPANALPGLGTKASLISVPPGFHDCGI